MITFADCGYFSFFGVITSKSMSEVSRD